MNFNFAVEHALLKASWFEISETNMFRKIGEHGLNLYLTLFKFRIYKQEHDYLFLTSIDLLRNETGYTNTEIIDLFKLLSKNKVLLLDNVSRWDRVKDKDLIICHAIDLVRFESYINDQGKPDKKALDYYVYVDFQMIEYYKKNDLNYRYYPLYCYLRYLCGINSESKAYAPIEDLALMTGYHKDTITKMIQNLNRHYLLYSSMRKNKSRSYSYFYYEHYICMKYEDFKGFKESWVKAEIDKNIKLWDKKKEVKAKNKNKKAEKST